MSALRAELTLSVAAACLPACKDPGDPCTVRLTASGQLRVLEQDRAQLVSRGAAVLAERAARRVRVMADANWLVEDLVCYESVASVAR